MSQFRDVPGEMKMAELNRSFFDGLTRRRLFRLLWEHYRRNRFRFRFGVRAADLLHDFLIYHISRDHEEDIIRRIFFVVISEDIFLLQLMKNIRVTDYREPAGALGIGCFKKPPAGAASGIIDVHIHLADNHVLLLCHLIRRECCVLHDVAENVDGDFRARVRHIDVINRPIEGGISVHIPAGFLHFLVDAAARSGSGPFEEHVFEHVRETGAQPAAFVNTTGHAPGLR